MKFKCKICEKQFDTEEKVLMHFKSIHGLKQNTHEFPCIINNSCEKQYLTIKGLRQHTKKCISKVQIENCISNEFVMNTFIDVNDVNSIDVNNADDTVDNLQNEVNNY